MWTTTVEDVELLRAGIVVAVLVLLALRARWAWRRRAFSVRVWRSIRLRHVAGSMGLILLVLTVAVLLWQFVPATRYGVGSLIGLDGNAVFAPIDSALQAPIEQAEQAAATGRPAPGVPWFQVAGVSAFLIGLTLLFPVLANAEELAFRVGWEDFDLTHQVASALRFGLVHMVMLIPLAAALAISVAGFAYGRVYVHAYRKVPPKMVISPWARQTVVDDEGYTRLAPGPPTPVLEVDKVEARHTAAFAATVWHTTFNTLIALLVLLGYLTSL